MTARTEQNWDVIAENDEDELQEDYLSSLKDVVLFAIDCSPSMMAPQRSNRKGDSMEPSETNSHLFATLKAAAELQKKKAMYEPNDLVGIILFNVMDTGDAEEQLKPHVSVFQPVAQVSADTILDLLSILSDVEEGTLSLEKRFRPWGRRVPLGDVFNACNWHLRTQAPKAATKRIFFVTDVDDPHDGNFQLDRIAKQNIADLYSLGVIVEPFFIGTEKKPFDPTKHFTDILSRAADDDEDAIQPMPTVVDGFSRILNEMAIRETPKRSQFSINMTLGAGLVIGVKGYSLVVEQKKSAPRRFLDVNGELKELETKTAYFSEENLEDIGSGASLVYGMSLPSAAIQNEDAGVEDRDIASRDVAMSVNQEFIDRTDAPDGPNGPLIRDERGQVIQKTPIYYTKEDVTKFRTLGMEPGIKILGFKDADTLVFEDNIKHSYFLYPNDTVYKGSTAAFGALMSAMVTKGKIGLALGLFRRNSSPYFYAMVPQEEVLDEDGAQERPPGFHMIPLPFADDIRAAPDAAESSLRASDNLVQAAAAWIKKVRIQKGYVPDAYPNPTLGLFYSQLQAMALREEFDAEQFSDRTAPQLESIFNRAGAKVEQWKEVLEKEPNAETTFLTSSSKRKADVTVNDLEVRTHYENETLSKMTVDMLKSFLRSKGKATSGTKPVLIERVTEYMKENP